MRRRLFPPRRPKNYGWNVESAYGSLDNASVTIFEVCFGANLTQNANTAKQQVNLQRVIVDFNLCVRTATLEDVSSIGVWSFMHYALILRDEEDDTVYDPRTDTNLRDETLLAHGITERIGWATIETVAFPVVSQPAAFMSQTKLRLDLRTNRRITSDQILSLYCSMDADASISRDSASDQYRAYMVARNLFKVP